MTMLLPEPLPYCKGCGHHYITAGTAKALEALGRRPTDVVLVTDIGCHGIADECFATHTVHGLHGRSVALGSGIAMALSESGVRESGIQSPGRDAEPPTQDTRQTRTPTSTTQNRKKVVVFIGDGGVTIGLQHLMEAIRLNVPMTVVVHNNMLYGMTGGQTSGLTPCGYKTAIAPEGNPVAGYDICALAREAGAPYVRRIVGKGDIAGPLAEAFAVDGFSLVEVVELCTSYGAKWNKGVKIEENVAELGTWRRERPTTFRLPRRDDVPSLLEGAPVVEARYASRLDRPFAVVMAGSAGEGVQSAAELFARGAMAAGLHSTKKGSYPVTVGVGFSTAEVIVAPTPIRYHGIATPNVVVITSQDGLDHQRKRIEAMTSGVLMIDASLDVPATRADVARHDFRSAGAKSGMATALLRLLREREVYPLEAFQDILNGR